MHAQRSLSNALRDAERYGGAVSFFREKMAISLDDVLRQMQEAGVGGLSAEDLRVDGSYHRFKPEGERKKKKSGWYKFFSIVTKTGREVIVGAYGRGPDTFKVRPSQSEWTLEEREEFKRKHAERQRELDKERAGHADEAAARAQKLWDRFKDRIGAAPYLRKKNVKPFGVRFGPRGAVMVPVRNAAGELRAIQWIDETGGKRFTSDAEIGGNFHLIGLPSDDGWLLIGEGYATCASAHMATGLPVAVAFDAGNLAKVAAVLRPLYPKAKFLFLGDDDRHLLPRLDKQLAKYGINERPPQDGKPHSYETSSGPVTVQVSWIPGELDVLRIEGEIRAGDKIVSVRLENAGRAKALSAAHKFKGRAIFPRFADPLSTGTDFNDLHGAQGLDDVRCQLERATASTPAADARARQTEHASCGGLTLQIMLDHWVFLRGEPLIWDGVNRITITTKAAVADLGDFFRAWTKHPDRQTKLHKNLIFDPTCQRDPRETINLYDGFESQPDGKKSCALLIAHLRNMCGGNTDLFDAVAKWLAYPLQHVGAKMRTALIIHGEHEGTGKSLFFDAMRQVYGRYGRVITQLQLEGDHKGDWMTQMLFCVAEEVVTASHKKDNKGLLKSMITSPQLHIDEKYKPGRQENNHANFVFLSNETQPMMLDKFDRRYTVIEYEEEHPPDYFAAIGAELAAGGAQGLFQWLLDYPLGDFNEYTRPYQTEARSDLIDLAKTSDETFYDRWREGYLEWPYVTCSSADLHAAYRLWVAQTGERAVGERLFYRKMAKREKRANQRMSGLKDGEQKAEDKRVRVFIIPKPCQGDVTELDESPAAITRDVQRFKSALTRSEERQRDNYGYFGNRR